MLEFPCSKEAFGKPIPDGSAKICSNMHWPANQCSNIPEIVRTFQMLLLEYGKHVRTWISHIEHPGSKELALEAHTFKEKGGGEPMMTFSLVSLAHRKASKPQTHHFRDRVYFLPKNIRQFQNQNKIITTTQMLVSSTPNLLSSTKALASSTFGSFN